MKAMGKIIMVMALCAGFAQVVVSAEQKYPRTQKVRAYKTNRMSMLNLWTVYTYDNDGNLISAAQFRKNTDKIPQNYVIDGKASLEFLFKNPKEINTIKVYKKNYLESAQDKIPAFKRAVKEKQVPEGSQIKITDTAVTIDTSKAQAPIAKGVDEQKIAIPSEFVKVKVLIPETKFPNKKFSLKSAPTATGKEYYDKVEVTPAGTKREGEDVTPLQFVSLPQKEEKGRKCYLIFLYVAPVASGEQNKASFIRINNKPGKRIVIRNQDAIKADTQIQVTTKQNLPVVNNDLINFI